MESLIQCLNLFLKKSKTPSALEIKGLLVLELTGSKQSKTLTQIRRKEFNPDKYQIFEDWLTHQNEFDVDEILEQKTDFENRLKNELKTTGHLYAPEFGLFYLDKGEEKKGINPKTRLPMIIPARQALYFFIHPKSEADNQLNFTAPLPHVKDSDYEKLIIKYFNP